MPKHVRMSFLLIHWLKNLISTEDKSVDKWSEKAALLINVFLSTGTTVSFRKEGRQAVFLRKSE